MNLDCNIRCCRRDDCLVGHTPREAADAAAAAAVVAAQQRLVQRVDAVDFGVEVRLERFEPLSNRKALCMGAKEQEQVHCDGRFKILCERKSCVRETKNKVHCDGVVQNIM